MLDCFYMNSVTLYETHLICYLLTAKRNQHKHAPFCCNENVSLYDVHMNYFTSVPFAKNHKEKSCVKFGDE